MDIGEDEDRPVPEDVIADDDFKKLNDILNEGEDIWEYVDHDENLSIYRKKEVA